MLRNAGRCGFFENVVDSGVVELSHAVRRGVQGRLLEGVESIDSGGGGLSSRIVTKNLPDVLDSMFWSSRDEFDGATVCAVSRPTLLVTTL